MLLKKPDESAGKNRTGAIFRPLIVLWFPFYLVFAILLVGVGVGYSKDSDFVIVLSIATSGWIVWRALQIRIVLTLEGLELSTLFRTRRFAATDIASIERPHDRDSPKLLLRSGGQVVIRQLPVCRYGRRSWQRYRDALESMAEHLGVPLTGPPFRQHGDWGYKME